jgi:hypothetical protein
MPLRYLKPHRNSANKNFKQYVAVNPYNEYEALGPSHNILKNLVTRPESHITRSIGAMHRGGDIERIATTIYSTANTDVVLAIAGASEDRINTPETNYEVRRRLLGTLATSHIQVTSWDGHYHPAMENLANARQAFRTFAHLS